MRIVSLLPSATEMVGALGMMDALVGVSHECEYPPEARTKPQVTRCHLQGAHLSSADLDRRVRELIQTQGTLYTLDEELIRELRPDVILTQQLCDVCAVGHGSVAAFARTLPHPPQVINLAPLRLADIFADIQRVAAALQVPERGEAVVRDLIHRVDRVRRRAAEATTRPRCVLLEWLDPPFSGGHWNPELISLAGGEDPLGIPGEPSRTLFWEAVLAARPEVILIACCGYTVERTLADLPLAEKVPGWNDLPAVRNRRVYIADASAYFTVPGPRVVDSLEIVAQCLHPELFAGQLPHRPFIAAYGSAPDM